jgi:hypothetical protein
VYIISGCLQYKNITIIKKSTRKASTITITYMGLFFTDSMFMFSLCVTVMFLISVDVAASFFTAVSKIMLLLCVMFVFSVDVAAFSLGLE